MSLDENANIPLCTSSSLISSESVRCFLFRIVQLSDLLMGSDSLADSRGENDSLRLKLLDGCSVTAAWLTCGPQQLDSVLGRSGDIVMPVLPLRNRFILWTRTDSCHGLDP
jgi:hypothetical protein